MKQYVVTKVKGKRVQVETRNRRELDKTLKELGGKVRKIPHSTLKVVKVR
jgi:hypothetical protein